MTSKERIAFLGTGIMGYPMARRLCEAGYSLSAWNRTPGKAAGLESSGARISATPALAASTAEIVIVMLSDGPVCNEILLNEHPADGAVLEAMLPGTTVIVMSSIPVESARDQARAAAARGLHYLDAPVSGGEKGAFEGTLAIMTGGESAVYERCRQLFEYLGQPTHVGAAGCGQLAKLANQMIVANTISTVAEALLLVKAGGADPSAVRRALLGGFADSTIFRQHGQRICQADWRPGGAAKHQLKDCRTALALARELGLDLPVSQSALDMYTAMVAHGDGDLDHSAVYLELLRHNHIDDTALT